MGKSTNYLTYDEFIADIINAELRSYDICKLDLDEMPTPGCIEGVAWYWYFTFKSKEEHDAWKEYVKSKIPQCHIYRFTPKSEYERITQLLDFNYGLRQDYEL